MAEAPRYAPKEIEQPQIAKAVAIMYPDYRTTGVDPRIVENGRPISIIAGKFHDVTGKLLDRYRKHGFVTIGYVYDDTLPENFSSLYPIDKFDIIQPVGATFTEWHNTHHDDMLDNVVHETDLSEHANVVVGGYHAFDCVVAMIRALQRNGHLATADLRLTNELAPLLIAHEVRCIHGAENAKESRLDDRLTWQSHNERMQHILEPNDV